MKYPQIGGSSKGRVSVFFCLCFDINLCSYILLTEVRACVFQHPGPKPALNAGPSAERPERPSGLCPSTLLL